MVMPAPAKRKICLPTMDKMRLDLIDFALPPELPRVDTKVESQTLIRELDPNGLLESTRGDLADFQKIYAHQHAPIRNFVEAIEGLKPTAIIGVSTVAKAFNQQVITAMARINQRPIIFPYSKPTSHSECTAEEAYRWSDGRAIFASGSPFPPVRWRDETLVPARETTSTSSPPSEWPCTRPTPSVSLTRFIAAARAVAEQVTQAELNTGLIYPPQSAIFKTETYAVARVAEVIFKRDLARVPKPADIATFIRARLYKPEYQALI